MQLVIDYVHPSSLSSLVRLFSGIFVLHVLGLKLTFFLSFLLSFVHAAGP